MSKRGFTIIELLIVLALIVVLAVAAFVQPKMEAATYRRLTGRQVSTWDALWVELRVMDCPQATVRPDSLKVAP